MSPVAPGGALMSPVAPGGATLSPAAQTNIRSNKKLIKITEKWQL
jgi:hypothetical protein